LIAISPTSRLTFSDADLKCLEALRASPEAHGWRCYTDRGETLDLVSVQQPFASEPIFTIIPAPKGVLMARKGNNEAAFPSLREALLSIGPRGEDWVDLVKYAGGDAGSGTGAADGCKGA
jgi:hypothetical protein